MLAKWQNLGTDFVEIFMCYGAMILGDRVGEDEDGLFAVYRWRGSDYFI